MIQAVWWSGTALVLLFVAAGCGGDAGGGAAGGGDDNNSPQDSGSNSSSSSTSSDASASTASVHDAGAGAAANDASSASDAAAQSAALGADEYFRLDKFKIESPGMVLRVLGVETEITSDVQDMIDSSMKEDSDPMDGNIDLNMLVHFTASGDVSKTDGKIAFGGAVCAYPLDATKACHADSSEPFYDPPLSYTSASKCQLDGADQSVSGACFKAGKGRMAVSLPLFGPVVLDDAQVIAAWSGGGVTQGWIRGFVSEQTAMTTTIRGAIPAHLALFDIKTGDPLTGFLPAAMHVDGESGSGWQFVAEFTAKPQHFESK